MSEAAPDPATVVTCQRDVHHHHEGTKRKQAAHDEKVVKKDQKHVKPKQSMHHDYSQKQNYVHGEAKMKTNNWKEMAVNAVVAGVIAGLRSLGNGVTP